MKYFIITWLDEGLIWEQEIIETYEDKDIVEEYAIDKIASLDEYEPLEYLISEVEPRQLP